MNRVIAASLAAVLSTAPAASAHAAPPSAAPLRQPAGKWAVDYGLAQCSAARTYGTGKDALTFGLRPSPSGSIVRMILLRQRRGSAAVHVPVTTSIAPARKDITALRFATNDGKGELVWIHFDRPDLDALASAGEIAISAARERPNERTLAGQGWSKGGKGWSNAAIDERIALPGVGAVLAALDKCNADLRAHWNVGGVEAGTIATPAKSLQPLNRYFSSDDYPAQALNEKASGASAFTLMVDEKGAPAGCMVEEASGIATLDAQVCALLQERAKFTPALDAAGKPARSTVSGRIRWVMPG